MSPSGFRPGLWPQVRWPGCLQDDLVRVRFQLEIEKGKFFPVKQTSIGRAKQGIYLGDGQSHPKGTRMQAIPVWLLGYNLL